MAIRSENLLLSREAPGLPAVIREKSFAGGMLRIRLELEGGASLIASRHGINLPYEIGEKVFVSWNGEQAVPVDREEGL